MSVVTTVCDIIWLIKSFHLCTHGRSIHQSRISTTHLIAKSDLKNQFMLTMVLGLNSHRESLLQPSTMRHHNRMVLKENKSRHLIGSKYQHWSRSTVIHWIPRSLPKPWWQMELIGWWSITDGNYDHRWRLTVPARRRRSIRVFPEYVGDQRGQVSGSTSRRKKLEEAKWKFNYPTSL